MPDLIVQFACGNPWDRAQEFQHHLVDQKLRVKPEAQEREVWLNYTNVQEDMIEKVIKEAHPWCLDRGLSLMEKSGEEGTPQTTVLLVADLARVVG